MIFQSLISLYDRLGEEAPPYGFSVEDIGFAVTIDRQGNIVGEPEDLRNKINANKYDFRQSVVPYSNKVNVRANAAAKTPNFMVDKADYLFGMSGKSKKDVHHRSFKKLIDEVCGESRDEGALAVRAFLDNWQPRYASELPYWKEMCGIHGKWVAFRLQGERRFIHEREAVRRLWADFVKIEEFPRGISFIDGESHDLQLQYAQFKFGSGASLVSFNEKAYESYGKKKGENAPISVEAEFKSSSALKHLLRSRNQRLRIGDATTVFWAERVSPVETFFGQILNPTVEDTGAMKSVQKFLEAVRQGTMPTDIERDRDIRFYILGLSLNKARLALRFWHVCSVGELMAQFRDHFNNLEMERSDRDIPFPGVWHLLKETARETKDISPVLAGSLTRSILTGGRYPQTLFQGVIGRIRADQAKKHPSSGKSISNVNYLRAAILKAVLQRNHNTEVPMSLDSERRETAYLLGRLFAVLEKAQLDALGKVNATIKDRFFSAASATPASVFPRLLRLSQHHIEKAEYGYVSDRRISEIMEHVDTFPAHLNLQDQGLFAIAYYHQKNALYRKNETKSEGGE
ncbi:type I-C CRISPR-associated protein Cas8c/Csd1 [Desulfomarina profundi]|uniref:Type I-C CRISPR-associated protein Cas8c/Csd1 n=1 Tax=Desulfomarina profundi TaxID=2772557 RepID=A0A8D5FUR6_9BACT|nr:type I-C CRISPR-associated protein Cas8c/Csd1 [Desulfomarina profundi]BCL62064.1 type I-C CRISPR-associated protein Cas8c/Csd1 [Desulfomarina profundi]